MLEVVVVVSAVAAGYYIKGISGMGEAIPLATIGVWFLPISDLVVIITLLDLIGSTAAMSAARVALVSRSDAPYIPYLVTGIAGGVGLLAWASTEVVTTAFIISLMILALLMTRMAITGQFVSRHVIGAPRASYERSVSSLYGGFSGGITGIDGPPLAAGLFRSMGGVDIREPLMRLILVSAAARTVLLVATGVATWLALGMAAALTPVAVGAFAVSRRRHRQVSPRVIAGLSALLCSVSSLVAIVR